MIRWIQWNQVAKYHANRGIVFNRKIKKTHIKTDKIIGIPVTVCRSKDRHQKPQNSRNVKSSQVTRQMNKQTIKQQQNTGLCVSVSRVATVSHKIINMKRQTLFLKWKLEVGKSTLKWSTWNVISTRGDKR